MRPLLASITILSYPVLAFATWYVIVFFRKHGYLSSAMLPTLSAEDVRFIYLVFTVPALLIVLYLLLYDKISTLRISYRALLALSLIPMSFVAFYSAHKLFYYFESVTTEEFVVKALTTTIPTVFFLLTVYLFERYSQSIGHVLQTGLVGLAPALLALLIVWGLDSTAVERGAIVLLGAALAIWTIFNIGGTEKQMVHFILPLVVAGAQVLYAGAILFWYWRGPA